ncbi:MAG: 30S ribosomal protein S16 [Nitriliruptoraceae bacterium]
MAVKLRLRREGTVKRPSYRIVAADSRSPRDGRFIEIIGEYRPLENPSMIRVDNERALHWLRHGAQPTSAVEKILRIAGVWEEFKPGEGPARNRAADKGKVSKKARARQVATAEEAEAAAAAPAAEAPVEKPTVKTAAADDAPTDDAVTDASVEDGDTEETTA